MKMTEEEIKSEWCRQEGRTEVCPLCKGKGDVSCMLCGGHGKVTLERAKCSCDFVETYENHGYRYTCGKCGYSFRTDCTG